MSISDLIKQRLDTNFLRFLAVIAVVNSHFDFLYPKGYGFLATGGAIGNSLFFLSSGFGLWFSVKYLNKYSFLQWFGKRCSRIYPGYIIVLPLVISVLLFKGDMNFNRLIDVGEVIFFPHGIYWFLQAMILFYLVIYGVFNLFEDKEKGLRISLYLSVVLYLLCYFFVIDLTVFSIESLPFKLVFYFICILVGMFLSSKCKGQIFGGLISTIMVIASLVIFFGSKVAMMKGYGFETQIVQHIGIMLLLIGLFSLSRTHFIIWLRKSVLVGKSIDFVANHSLEIYLVHIPIILFMKHVGMVNGLYVIPLIIITLILSSYLGKLTKKLIAKLES